MTGLTLDFSLTKEYIRIICNEIDVNEYLTIENTPTLLLPVVSGSTPIFKHNFKVRDSMWKHGETNNINLLSNS